MTSDNCLGHTNSRRGFNICGIIAFILLFVDNQYAVYTSIFLFVITIGLYILSIYYDIRCAIDIEKERFKLYKENKL